MLKHVHADPTAKAVDALQTLFHGRESKTFSPAVKCRQSEEEAVGSSQAGQLRQAAQFMAAAVGKRRSEAEQALRLQQTKLVGMLRECNASMTMTGNQA